MKMKELTIEDLLDIKQDFFRTNIGKSTYVVLTGSYDAKPGYQVLQIISEGNVINPPNDDLMMKITSEAIRRFIDDPCRKEFIKYFRDNYTPIKTKTSTEFRSRWFFDSGFVQE